MYVNAQVVDQAINDIQKAISSVDVSSLLLVREDLQAEMAIAAPTDTPLRNRFNRIQGNGKAHSWYQLVPTTVAEGDFLGTSPAQGFFERGGLPDAQTPKYKFVSAPYTSLGDVAQVSFFEQMAGGTYTDIKKHQIKVKMLNTALIEEFAIINGDSSVGSGLQFDGLRKQITANIKDNTTSPLALDDINTVEQNIVTKGGKPQALVMGYRDVKKFNDLVFTSHYRLFQAGAGSMSDIPAGISITRWTSPFGTVDVIGSRYLPASGNAGEVLIIDDKTVLEDGNAIQMVDLMPLSAIDLSLLQSAYRTLVAEFTVLQVTAPTFQGKIINVGD